MKTQYAEYGRIRHCFVLLCVFFASGLRAQSVLQDYVTEGLESNLVVQQRNRSLNQAQIAFQIARSQFLPAVSLLGDYTSGEGGRSISIPTGDLLNPVYATLNQLTQSDEFPQIKNVKQNFFPYNMYDVRVHTTMALLNTDLQMNRTIKGQQVLMERYELETYKRELVMEIKSAYYQYLSAVEAVKIYESAQRLVNKNLEVNESLLNNGKSLPAYVLRSKSEVEQVKADLNQARNQVTNASRYFNFLLNKPLDSDIQIDASLMLPTSVDSLNASSPTVDQREELAMLKTAREINATSVRMYQLSRLPQVNAFLDLGSQAQDWQFNDQSRYYLVGVQVSMPLFNGFRTNLSIRQHRQAVEETSLNLQYTTAQLQVAADMAQHNVATALQNFTAAREQLRSARSYFNLIEKGYQEGVNSLIEFLDARNGLTRAQLQQNLRLFDTLTALAHLEREAATYTFE